MGQECAVAIALLTITQWPSHIVEPAVCVSNCCRATDGCA